MNWRDEYSKSLLTSANLALVGLVFNGILSPNTQWWHFAMGLSFFTRHASGSVGCEETVGEEETMDNFTLTMLGLTVFILVFGLAVDRLTREDYKRKDNAP